MRHAVSQSLRIVTAVAALGAAGLASAADVTIKVDNVKDTTGKVRVIMFDAAGFLRVPLRDEGAPAVAGSTVVVLKDVAPGDYAFVAYHDTNGDGKLDMGPGGMPTEMFGFSNNPVLQNAPPAFDAAKVVVTATGASANATLMSLP